MSQDFKTGQNVTLPIFLTDSADHISGKTGATLAVSAGRYAFDGTTAVAYGALTITTQFTVSEIGNGWYRLNLLLSGLASLLGGTGTIPLHITATGADPTDISIRLVGFNPANNIANQEDSASTTIAGSVWNALTASYATSNTFGAKLGNALTSSNVTSAVWDAAISSYTTSGTFGKVTQDTVTNTKTAVLGYDCVADTNSLVSNTNTVASRLNKTFTYSTTVPSSGGMSDQGNITANVEKYVGIVHGTGTYDSAVALSSTDRLNIAKAVWGFDLSASTTNESATFTSYGTYPSFTNVAGTLIKNVYDIVDDQLTNQHGAGAWSAVGTVTTEQIAEAVWEYDISGISTADLAGTVLNDVPTTTEINTALTSAHGSGSWSQTMLGADIDLTAAAVWTYGTRRLTSVGITDIVSNVVTGGPIICSGGLVTSDVSKIAGVTVISNAGPSNNQWGRSS